LRDFLYPIIENDLNSDTMDGKSIFISVNPKNMNNIKNSKKELSGEQHAELMKVLQSRFENHMNRHT
jgi:hypothetical protein